MGGKGGTGDLLKSQILKFFVILEKVTTVWMEREDVKNYKWLFSNPNSEKNNNYKVHLQVMI